VVYLDLDINFSSEKYSPKDKIILLILFFIFAPLLNKAQKKADIGLMSGVSYYIGDINPSKHFYKPGILYSAFYRYNFHKRYSLKSSINYASLKADDADFTNSRFQLIRNENFASKILDVSFQFEFNFWPYITTLVDEDRYSPYIFAGFTGFYSFGQFSSVHYGIPFGAGFKFNLNKRFGIGLEYSFRKTFTDMIDGSTNWGSTENFAYTKDWYSFSGFFVSYKFYTKNLNCPTYIDQ